jgi:hypothetical protein
MRPTASLMFVAGFALLSCAGDDAVETRFDSSAGLVTVALHGDGFVDVDGRRVPLEALVLDLRRSTREMAREELLRFVVRVRLGAAAGADALRKQQAARARLLGELEIMGVRQIVYL